ncbi:MAG: hypothetical protein LBB74_01640 [Chitinispirillales bacterium]|jgi:hypothetical protein|nr:hypothetical protein [Chitinispirillales bacterium]
MMKSTRTHISDRRSPLSVIRNFAARRRRRLLLGRAFSALSVAAVAYLAMTAALGIAFSAYPWTALPVVWVAATFIVALVFLLIPPIVALRRPTLARTAAIIEGKCDIAHPSLSIALELSTQDDRTAGSPPLLEQAYRRAAEQLGPLGNVSVSSVNKYIAAAVIVLLFVNVSITAFSANGLTGYWKLPFAFLTAEQVRVEPGSVTVPLNSAVTLALSGAAQRFPTARLEVWPLDGGNRARYFLRADSAGSFSRSFDNLKESFVYRFSLSAPLPPETVTVVPPPLLRSLQLSMTPPRYTKLPPRELPPGQGNITAYPGTRVQVTLESNALRGAGMVFGGKDTAALDIRGKTATGAFTVAKSTEYTFYLIDTLGQVSDSLPRFMVSAVPDEAPVARILKPGMNKVLTTAQVETLWVEGVDDFGVARMELKWRRSGEPVGDPPYAQDLSEAGSPPLIRKPVVWNIRELSLYPGDSLCYWLWVRDNRQSGGAQTACSDTFWFRVPSFEEIHKAVAVKEQYAREKLGEARNRQDNIRGSIEKLVKSAAGSKELSWDQKRVLDDVKAQLNAQADSLQKALQALEDGIEAMREDGKLNEELLAKMEQVKKSVEELMKEFGENIFKMNGDRELSMNDMRQAASKLKDMLPELSERLDQTLAFLEKMRQDKQLAELALRAENLAGEQAELAASKQDPLIDRRQKELLDRIDGFNKDVMDFFKEQGGELPPSSEQVRELSEEMKRQGGQSKSDKPDDAKKGGDKESRNAMTRELMSLSEQLKSNLTVNMAAKMEADRKRILSMAHDALTLEEWQQTIKIQAQGTSDDRGTAFAQQALGNAIRMSLAKSDSLTMVGSAVMREILRVYRNASAKSANAVNSLGGSDGSRQMDQSVQALRELANVLLSIVGDDESGGGGGGGGGMMSGLRRASGRQAALNSMIGDMLQSLLGDGKIPGGQGQGQGRQMGQGRPSGQGSGQGGGEGEGDGGGAPGGRGEADAEARKQAREAQKAIAEELKRLADTYGKEAGEGMEKRVRELEQEARGLARLLENPPADIVDLQDRFLSRMLQSTLSLNRKDEGKEERKGTVSRTLFSDRGSKAAGSGAAARADSFHLLRKRAFEDNFPEEYRSAIREYFDVLGEMKWDE